MPDSTSLAQPNNQLANATPNVNTFYGADGAIQAQTINNLQVNLSLDTPEAVERFSQIFQGMTPVAQSSGEIHAATSSLHPQTTTDPQPIPIQHAIEWASLDSEYYCLFVLENEEYNCGAFSIAKSVALTKYTEETDIEKYRSLNAAAIQSLVGMPCIFAKRNNFYNRTDDLHPAIFGCIREIKNQGRTIKIIFEGFQSVSQQLLNEHTEELGLARASLRNELDEEHWSIKRGNLQQILADLGIQIY